MEACGEIAAVEDCLIVVTGLPRSGTSMLMQMLAAGGVKAVADGRRTADEDNPRGYLEFEPVKKLLSDSEWLRGERGKAVKIVAPLISALPMGLDCRVILSERDLEEVLDSQERMLARNNRTADPGRRERLKEEFARTMVRVKKMLAARPRTRVLTLERRDAIANPAGAAAKVNQFLGGGLDEAKMVSAVDASLHRNRRSAAEAKPKEPSAT